MEKPKIRFKGYQEDWEQRKLDDVLKRRIEQRQQSEEYPRLAFASGQGVIPLSERKTNNREQLTKDEYTKKYLVTELNDIVYNPANVKYGAIDRNKCGRGLISPIYVTFTTNEVPGFIERIVTSHDFQQRALRFEEGTVTKRQSVNPEDLVTLDILVAPKREEQQKIATYFDSLDHLITLHQRKCEEMKTLKKYMLQKMFPQNGQLVPQIRFSGFTEDWEQRKLGDIASSFEYGLNAAAKEYDGENKYIRITDIDDNTHEFLTDNLTSPDIDLTGADNYKLTERDILFARTGASVGKSYIYRNSDGLVYYAGFLIRARIKEEYDAEFVFQNTLTDRYNKYIAVTSQRSGQPGVNAQEYAEFEIEVPKKEEQTKIGTYFRNIDHLITLHQQKCDELRNIKKFMLQNMFI